MLSFVRQISTPRPAATEAWLEVGLVADGKLQHLIPPGELGQASPWTLATLDLTPWRGQTVELQFQVVRCSAQSFSVNLDRISLGKGSP